LEAFAQLGTELDAATQKQLDRGARLVELLKQPQYKPMPLEQQVMVIYAGTKGYMDDVPVNRILDFQDKFLQYVDSSAAGIRSKLNETKDQPDDIEKDLKAALTDFKAKVWKK